MAIIVHSLSYNPSTFGWYKGFTLTLETPIHVKTIRVDGKREPYGGDIPCVTLPPPLLPDVWSWHTTKGEIQHLCSLLWQLSSYTRCSRLLTDSASLLPITSYIRHHYLTVQPIYTQKPAPILKADKFLCLLVRDSCLWRDLLEFWPHGVFVGEDADDVFMCSVNRMWDMWNLVTFWRKSAMWTIYITCSLWNATLSPNDFFILSLVVRFFQLWKISAQYYSFLAW